MVLNKNGYSTRTIRIINKTDEALKKEAERLGIPVSSLIAIKLAEVQKTGT